VVDLREAQDLGWAGGRPSVLDAREPALGESEVGAVLAIGEAAGQAFHFGLSEAKLPADLTEAFT